MKKNFLFVCLIVLFGSSIQAQSYYNTDFSSSVTTTDNLFKNSSDVKENLASFRGSVNLYPVHFGQMNIFSEYTNYGNNPDLSNIRYGGGITLLPLSDSSNFTLLLNLNYQGFSYKDALTTNSSDFSNENIDGIFSLGYQLNERTSIRSGFNYSLTGYASDSVTDKKSKDIFTGLNISLLGSNVIDFEGGYSFEKYDYIPEYIALGTFNVHYRIRSWEVYSILEEAELNSFYLSLRYSRPLGSKSGLSISYYFREFIDTKDSSMIYGYSTGYLSPWIASYDGNSIQAKIKSYLIPFTILNIGFGYWNSSYLRIIESDNLPDPFTKNGIYRNDDKYQMYLSFSIPIVTSSGRLFEPTLNFDYTDNESSISNYTYSDFTVTMSLNIK